MIIKFRSRTCIHSHRSCCTHRNFSTRPCNFYH